MAVDALAAGPNGSYPWFPRLANGEPAWSDDPLTDGIAVMGKNGQLVSPMPRGTRHIRRDGGRIKVDVTPRHVDGSPINPPTVP